jgi:polyhydroxyalkanoate synthesis regulator protein
MLSPQLLSQIIRFYGDSLQGFMGPYLERSLQVFLDQQQQFRNQLNSLMGQTPWSLLNELTERNLDAWKNMQRGFLDAASQASGPTGQAGRGGPAKKP